MEGYRRLIGTDRALGVEEMFEMGEAATIASETSCNPESKPLGDGAKVMLVSEAATIASEAGHMSLTVSKAATIASEEEPSLPCNGELTGEPPRMSKLPAKINGRDCLVAEDNNGIAKACNNVTGCIWNQMVDVDGRRNGIAKAWDNGTTCIWNQMDDSCRLALLTAEEPDAKEHECQCYERALQKEQHDVGGAEADDQQAFVKTMISKFFCERERALVRIRHNDE